MHRGEIVKEAIKKSGIAVGVVADRIGLSRRTLYNKFKETSIPYSLILKIGEVIHYDFSEDFPHLSRKLKKENAENLPLTAPINLELSFDGSPAPAQPETETPPPPREVAPTRSVQECEAELIVLQRKYIALLEKFNELLLKTS
ncbi:hypothetical protein FVR03_22020 [Pontibacter qinzhouensis]|uniref:DNA binding HTH domain-containing protein n=1 Tax=Pontibacter qinzhouensis TaxID=2603253 RepID=A0A5C8IY44_9BACT|nr:hypothetical protein [Pontibacter qinzhouensis]TXK26210.1 hypothetical protein FVR03_22020 [Pontibacter qinzhouensis]